MDAITITVPTEISAKRIDDLLCGALDGGYGGSWYWINDYKKKSPTDTTPTYLHEYPMAGGSISFNPIEEDEWYTLDTQTIQDGLILMANEYKRHWADFIKENDDAITSDVFLQLCLFGKIVFG